MIPHVVLYNYVLCTNEKGWRIYIVLQWCSDTISEITSGHLTNGIATPLYNNIGV